jgi:hypothetical protein
MNYNNRYFKQSIIFTLTVIGLGTGIFYYRDLNKSLRMRKIERDRENLPEMKSVKDFEKDKKIREIIEESNANK